MIAVHPRSSIRLVTSNGRLVEQPEPERAARSVVITIEEIEPARVVLVAETSHVTTADELYRLAGEEALRTAVRSALSPHDQMIVVRLHLEALTEAAPLDAVRAAARAVRFGPRAVTATVTVRAGNLILGRGGLVTIVRSPTRGTQGPVPPAARIHAI